ENIAQKLKNKQFILIPIVTESETNSNQIDEQSNHHDKSSIKNKESYVRAIAMFLGKLLKVNRVTNKIPSITVYKVQKYNEENEEEVDKVVALFQKLLNTTEHPIDQKVWDKEINEVF